VSGAKAALARPLVPVDGSAASLRAVEHVVAQMSPGDGRVHVINVQPPIMAGDVNFFMSARMAADRRRAAGERALRAARALLDAHRIEHTSEVVFGNPVDAILRCAVERGCTKIVMGTKGRSLIANLLARSVASRVVRRAHVPVTLVKKRAPPTAAPFDENARPAPDGSGLSETIRCVIGQERACAE
jgi:nucleotide-binding universal stress UspA family protein